MGLWSVNHNKHKRLQVDEGTQIEKGIRNLSSEIVEAQIPESSK